MKIAFIEPHLQLYGAIRRIMELSNRLVRRGEDVTVYHPGGGPCEWMHGVAKTRPTRELFDTEHDVVIFNDPPDYKLARKARAKLKVFYVLCLYEREKLKKFNPKIFWIRKGRTLSLKRALQMPFLRLANATWMQTYLAQDLGLESHLLLGGVNRDVFHPLEAVKGEVAAAENRRKALENRRAAPETGRAFRILCSGDTRERKGLDTIRAALERVTTHHAHVVLDTYHDKGIPQKEMAETYGRADLFVDAQRYAGWNNPVAEAMACGTPVVCSDIGGVADFAVHEETALLVPVGDAEALAGAIRRAIGDPMLCDRLKSNALAKISQFDWERSADTLRDILRTHLSQNWGGQAA
ncbi:MAG: glycosyltransferase family 4 protein [Candidatus Krumholzibacteria bacterium]